MKTTGQLALLALCVLLSACVTQDSLKKAISNPEHLKTLIAPKAMTADEEKHFGREAAATLLGAAPLVRDEAVQSYCKGARYLNAVKRDI